ncbi:MAG: phosphotransferase [Pseudomonadota bacterium]|nr:phosphotransferase [Pseudomonadota bacterium]
MTPREQARAVWLSSTLGGEPERVEALPVDASFRRYFRVWRGGVSRIVMDAPPDRENAEPFVHVAGLMRRAGVHVPEVLAYQAERGFLLLTDLGSQSYLDVIDETNADGLFADALEALVRWQGATRAGALPPYDAELLGRELDLFPTWYVERHCAVQWSEAEWVRWSRIRQDLIDSAVSQPQVFVHRDYMPRNLMISEPNPGVIDFQDAVIGPVTYDVVSLFRDAFLSWDDAHVSRWFEDYWQRARLAGIALPAEFGAFRRAADWMGVQRHLKVLGIFARLKYRDGKDRYLGEAPRFIAYLRRAIACYGELAPLGGLLDGLSPTAGETVRD